MSFFTFENISLFVAAISSLGLNTILIHIKCRALVEKGLQLLSPRVGLWKLYLFYGVISPTFIFISLCYFGALNILEVPLLVANVALVGLSIRKIRKKYLFAEKVRLMMAFSKVLEEKLHKK
ncbi:hypothetical protein GT360_17785 [Vibrio astriarenae]|uniref:Uncharacterized protein n=1 Tax=Vibrio astriarenae TaxID=1481923 RepID=A0A7Z2T6S4_9VIBR|nr:hypothetical protein [Vibrio astriarenae]QIA65391.1 hypothetical protein GT360_17785 [Vibrio astriarenae]